jgi:lipoprotein-anchoring transpeptidase ErfK/SrfK
MSFRSHTRAIVLAALVATPLLVPPHAARAQDLIDLLWGGTDEWGGKRQVVDFDPKFTKDQIIVSFGDRRLYLITQKGKAISYPIAVPREQSRWQGTTIVSEKKMNPSWRPTPDMLKENPKLPTWVPGGHPMNPLGVRAMYLGASTYRIHGTDSPWTIGQAVSKGCIRMYNEDVEDLYPRVPVGMKVTVTWQQFNSQSVAANDDGTPAPFDPSPVSFGTSSKGARAAHSMTSTSSAAPAASPGVTPDNVGAANKLPPPDPSTDDKPSKPVAKAKPKAKAPETTAASAASKGATPAVPATTPPAAAKPASPDAVAAATKAAEAATRAAEAARAAAEAAKKAAADAKKATSADGDKEPGKDDAAKRAAL